MLTEARGVLLSLLLPYSLETGSHTSPGTRLRLVDSSHQAPAVCLSLLPMSLGLQVHAVTPAFCHACWGIKLAPFCLYNKQSYPLSHLSSSSVFFYYLCGPGEPHMCLASTQSSSYIFNLPISLFSFWDKILLCNPRLTSWPNLPSPGITSRHHYICLLYWFFTGTRQGLVWDGGPGQLI